MTTKAVLGVRQAVLLAALVVSMPAFADQTYRVTGPFAHDNLSIYLIHGAGRAGAMPRTLSEALIDGSVTVHETDKVTELAIENKGAKPVFIQSGDVVRGGKQDRVLTISLLLPPKSGRVAISSFCVEQGRWTKRGAESVRYFTSSRNAMPSKRAKLAMKLAPPTERTRMSLSAVPRSPDLVAGRVASRRAGAYRGHRENAISASLARDPQSSVWQSVEKTQRRLSERLNTIVSARQSQSSLVLSLENKHLKQAVAAYVKTLAPVVAGRKDVLGYAFAINGKINSADVYPSHGLFMKMWPKLLRASVTEAISEKGEGKPDLVQLEPQKILSFLKRADAGKLSKRPLVKGAHLLTRQVGGIYMFETKLGSRDWIHRNYIAN